MSNKQKAIIFDLDWVLCELWDSVNPYNHDWEEIAIPEMEFMFQALWYFDEEVEMFVLTGRKYKEYWKTTQLWLDRNHMFPRHIFMQEGSTAEKNHIFKKKKLEELKEKYEILFMVDDNPDMIQVCKELWITLLHVNR